MRSMWCMTATRAIERRRRDYDVIILDVMLPEMDGYEVCRELRQNGNQTP